MKNTETIEQFLNPFRIISEAFGSGDIQTMRVFDFDDTIAETEANIIIMRPPDFTEELMSPADFAVYHPIDPKTGEETHVEPHPEKERMSVNSLGEEFDFREFDQILNPVKIKHVTAIFKRLIAAGEEGRYVSILTARGAPVQEHIRGYLMAIVREVGLDPTPIERMDIVCLGSSDPMKKAVWIVKQARNHPEVKLIEFFDDSPKNRNKAMEVIPKALPGVKVRVFDPVDLEGKVPSFVHNDIYSEAKERLDKEKMKCNTPKRTPSHPTKSHVVKACENGKEKIIRFGEQGASTAGKPKKGESAKMKAKRASFKSRHGKNIAKGKMSAAYWADKVKW